MPDHATAAAHWIATHPRAMALFESMALRRAAVRQPFGMKALVETVRWHHAIDTDQTEEWKLNNNFTSYLARWLIDRHPEIASFIELRHVGPRAA
jgi:hypothetical protein